MSKYAGTQTEKICWRHFQGNPKRETNTLILRPEQKKTDMSRLRHCSRRRQTMKKNMRRCGSKN